MLRLTRNGKIVLGVLAVGLAVGLYFMFFAPKEQKVQAPSVDWRGVPLSEPVDAPPRPFKTPLVLQGSAIRAWEQAAAKNSQAITYCSFFMPDFQPTDPEQLTDSNSYAGLRGKPLDFRALVPKQEDLDKSPYTFVDRNGRTYYPVYPIAPVPDGQKVANQAVESNVEEWNQPCGLDPIGKTIMPVLVAFPKGQTPSPGDVVRVLGYMAYDSGNLNPRQPGLQTGATGTTTVVNAGLVIPGQAQEALDPPFRERQLNIAIRRGDFSGLRIGKIQFAQKNTRVWVEVVNRSNRTLQGWPSTLATLGPVGAAASAQGAGNDSENTQALLNPESGLFPADQQIQPGKKLAGWVLFPHQPDGQTLILSLPDPNPEFQSKDVETPIFITLPPELNQVVNR